MEVKDYCSIALLVIVVIAYSINILITIKCKKSTGATKTELDSFVSDELSKLKEVFDDVEKFCTKSNYTFDKSYWTTLINNIVAVMNGEDTFQSTETTDSTNVIIK